jgi:hypothetical protein
VFFVKRKTFRSKKAFFFVLLFFSLKAVFGQTTARIALITDYFTAFNDFAAEMASAMSFMGGMGLAWSDPYIGHLINPIPHWGFGLSLGATSLSFANLDKLNQAMHVEMEPFLPGKQFHPVYTGELRIGGFRTVPFDLGLKFGMLPDLPLYATGTLNYNIMIVGGDFRWCINRGFGIAPKMSIGFEFNYVTGGYSFSPDASAVIAEKTNASGTTASGRRLFPGTGALVNYTAQATVFDLKLDMAKRFPYSGFTFFGQIKAGAAITSTSFILSGEGVGWGTSSSTSNQLNKLNTDAKLATANETFQALLPYGQGTITTLSATVAFPGFAIDAQGRLGIAFDLDRWHISIAYMMDVLHFESGIALSFRYQQ